MDFYSVLSSLINVGTTVGSTVNTVAGHKLYLERNLIPLQIYMDDIDNISQKISSLDSGSIKYKCRLDDLQDRYRRVMGFDRFVMVKTPEDSFKLFEALNMEFDVGDEAKQMLLEIITMKYEGFEIENGMKLIVTNGESGEADELMDEMSDSLVLTYSKTQIICYQNNNKIVGQTDVMDETKIYEILQRFRLLKHLNRVYIQTEKSEIPGKYEWGDEIPGKYEWVGEESIYRGAYKPLSPLTCNRIKNSNIKSKGSGYNTKYVKALVSQWNNLEYIYTALKAQFEEINLQFTLQLTESANKNHNSIDKLITLVKKLETHEGVTRDSAEDRDKDKRTEDNAKFHTFVNEKVSVQEEKVPEK